MDVDPLEAVPDEDDDKSDAQAANARRRSRLNNWVAITVAILATFMGICKVKDDNVVQAMQQAQADKIDNWSYYQARNIREEIAKSTRTQLELQALGKPATVQSAYAKQIAAYDALAKDQNSKKADVKALAEKADKDYNALNIHDDQFDLSDALLAIAISLLALTSLTQKRWLFWLASVPIFFGVLFGLAGLLGWHIHPDALTKLLS